MLYENIVVTVADHIATILLNRPEKRNAMHGPLIKEMIQALENLMTDSAVQVLVIRGTGEHFCAGADIGWMKQIAAGSYSDNYDDAQLLADFLYNLYHFPKPTVALVHGATMGGGLGIVAACDIAFAAKNASFGFSEVKVGIAPCIISPYVLAAIGERQAHYYFLTGERFNAEEAQRIGFVHRVVENEVLLSTGIALAKTLQKNGPHALTAVKQLIRQVAKEKITEELTQKTAEYLANLRSSPEGEEGLRAFLEKRTPVWND